jgi:Predicted membrane protein
VFEIAALGAALCWSMGGIIATTPIRSLGAIAFTRIRMLFIAAMLTLAATLTGGWETLSPDQINLLLLSGIVGIFFGDTALFAALKRIGPRRATILFATHAPMTLALGYLWLNETLTYTALLGTLLVTMGVITAVFYGSRSTANNPWEAIQGSLITGVLLALLGALGQSMGSLIARPVMADGVDAIAASAIRSIASAAFLVLLGTLPVRHFRAQSRLTPRILLQASASALIGMGIGMTLFLFALTGSQTGIVATLSSTSPVLMLPILWMLSGERPSAGAWVGAIAVVVGTSLIFLG